MRAKPGQKTKACLQVTLEEATWAGMRCTSSACMGLVTRSPFLEGLGAGEGGIELPHGPGHVPGNA